jgi:phosphoglycolate phosphatase-like HAD superfamily hydrolase
MVGDRQGDIDAGRAAGVRTVHVRHEGEPDVTGADHQITAIPELLAIAL